jgi:hypothetical protein
VVSVEGFQATFLFLIALKPDFLIRMGIGKSLQKGRRTFFVKIQGAYKRCHWIKS